MRYQCSGCHKIYEIDLAKLKNPQAKLGCPQCKKLLVQQPAVVAPPPEPTTSNDDPFWGAPTLAGETQTKVEPSATVVDNSNVGMTPEVPPPAAASTLEPSFGSLDDYDLSADPLEPQLPDVAAAVAPVTKPVAKAPVPAAAPAKAAPPPPQPKVTAPPKIDVAPLLVPPPPPAVASMAEMLAESAQPAAPERAVVAPRPRPAAAPSTHPMPPVVRHDIPKVNAPVKRASQLPSLLGLAGVVLVLVVVGMVVMNRAQNRVAQNQVNVADQLIAKSRQQTTAPIMQNAPSITPPPVAAVVQSPYELGMQAYQQHDLSSYREAEKHLLQAYQEESKSPRTALALAELYALLSERLQEPGLLKKAQALVESQANQTEYTQRYERTMAQTYLYGGQWTKALQHIQKAVQLDGTDAEAQYIKAMIALRQGRSSDDLAKAYSMDPKSFRIASAWVKQLQTEQQYSDAAKVANQMIATWPLRYESHYAAMLASKGLERLQEAYTFGEQALKLNMHDVDLNIDVALLSLSLGEPKRASAQLEEMLAAIEKMPRKDLMRIYVVLGKANVNTKPEKAVFYLKKLVDWKQENTTILNDLGLSYLALKQYQQAADSFAKALALSQGNPAIRFNLALTHYQAQSFSRSQQLFEEIIRANPKHAEASYYLGMIYKKRGDRTKAMQWLQQAMNLSPTNQLAREQYKLLQAGL